MHPQEEDRNFAKFIEMKIDYSHLKNNFGVSSALYSELYAAKKLLQTILLPK